MSDSNENNGVNPADEFGQVTSTTTSIDTGEILAAVETIETQEQSIPEIKVANEDPGVAKISIVGGGASGLGTLLNVLSDYERRLREDLSVPQLRVDFFDSADKFGVGVPYDLDTFVFRLNQPAEIMSIYHDRPGNFVEWLKQRDDSKNIKRVAEAKMHYKKLTEMGLSENQIATQQPEVYDLANAWGSRDAFIPRALFGEYLREQLNDALDRVESLNAQMESNQVSVVRHVADVDGLNVTKPGHMTISAAEAGDHPTRSVITANAVALATGHHKQDMFEQFEDNPNYVATPIEDVSAIKDLVGDNLDPEQPLFILGTSQSMLDALSALDAIGYKGKIIAGSTRGVEPWPYDPAKHHDERKLDYELEHLNPETISALAQQHKDNPDKLAAEVRELIRQELHSPKSIQEGVKYVLNNIMSPESSICKALSEVDPRLAEICHKAAEDFAYNHTFPERYELYNKYKESGQLEIMTGYVDVNTTSEANQSDGFAIKIRNKAENTEHTVIAGKFINCAAFARAPFKYDKDTGFVKANDPVTQAAINLGLVEPAIKASTIGPKDNAVAYVDAVGPNRTTGWGVPYTKRDFKIVAGHLLDHALAEADKERLLSGSSLMGGGSLMSPDPAASGVKSTAPKLGKP